MQVYATLHVPRPLQSKTWSHNHALYATNPAKTALVLPKTAHPVLRANTFSTTVVSLHVHQDTSKMSSKGHANKKNSAAYFTSLQCLVLLLSWWYWVTQNGLTKRRSLLRFWLLLLGDFVWFRGSSLDLYCISFSLPWRVVWFRYLWW